MERKLKWKCNVCNEPVKVGQRTKHLREKHPELKDAKSVEYFVLNVVPKKVKKEKQSKKAEKKQRKGLLKVKKGGKPKKKPVKAELTKVEKEEVEKREAKTEKVQKTNGKLIVKENGKILVIPIVPKGLNKEQFKHLLKGTRMTPKEFYDLPTDMKEKIVKAEKELIEVA